VQVNNKPGVRTFTIKANGRLNVITSDVHVHEAFDVTKGQPPVARKFTGLWDTGASASVISRSVVDALGLMPTGMATVNHAAGTVQTETYLVGMMLPNEVGFPVLPVTLGTLAGFDVLIGMDVICNGDFSISNFGGETVFSFRMPSLHHNDFGEKNLLVDKAHKMKKVRPGKLCPCGSLMKFKHCHGLY